ncbi:hypothetical protein D0863_08746 [Hortaea werneckii]|uniref:AB hydrolase-1 domain-containing protein n=1 Tax=Hortaea werneckii TaxID=91943 RepID=A0A3M7DP24_HORWE|nr:hypothetical protein D0863_08746 [Hortaea werneckii]
MDALQEKQLQVKRGFNYRYFVSSHYKASNPVLLLLHGWPDNANLWQYVLPYLRQLNCKIVVPDLLGYARTTKPTDLKAYDYRLMCQDMLDILAAEGIEDNVITIGHDFGIAYMPPMPQALDPDAFFHLGQQEDGSARYIYWELFTSPEAPKLFAQHNEAVWHALHGAPDDMVKQMFCFKEAFKNFLLQDRTDVDLRPYAQDTNLHDAWIQDFSTEVQWEASFAWYNSFISGVQTSVDKTIPPEKYRLEMPVLFISCDGDAVNPHSTIDGPKDAGLLPDLTEEELHSGHWCPYEKPEELGTFKTVILDLFDTSISQRAAKSPIEIIMSNFLDLPPQLRNYIYILILRNEPVWSLVIAEDLESWRLAALGPIRRRSRPWYPHTMHWPAHERELNVICSMAYVCRQIRNEMTPIIAARRRPHPSRDAHWSDALSEEAGSSSLEIRVLMNLSGSHFAWNVIYGMLPAKHQVFLVFEGEMIPSMRRNLVAAMGAYMVEKGTGLMVGDFDPERMAALTVAEFQSGPTALWSFSLHRRNIECIRRVVGVRRI